MFLCEFIIAMFWGVDWSIFFLYVKRMINSQRVTSTLIYVPQSYTFNILLKSLHYTHQITPAPPIWDFLSILFDSSGLPKSTGIVNSWRV